MAKKIKFVDCDLVLPTPPVPPLHWIREGGMLGSGETFESRMDSRKYDAASDFWSAMFKWVEYGRIGKMPYPKQPVPHTPLRWWQFPQPLYKEKDYMELARFTGEVEEFARWLPWTTIKGKNGKAKKIQNKTSARRGH